MKAERGHGFYFILLYFFNFKVVHLNWGGCGCLYFLSHFLILKGGKVAWVLFWLFFVLFVKFLLLFLILVKQRDVGLFLFFHFLIILFILNKKFGIFLLLEGRKGA